MTTEFDPDDGFLPWSYNGKRRRVPNPWVAPEHANVARSMSKDFPRDDFGRPLKGSRRELVLDKRPDILVPKNQPYTNT